MYTIGEVAKIMNVAPSTLRFYDKEGLLPFVNRTEGNIRIFKDEDFELLENIEYLKAAGMPIKDIKLFLDWAAEGDSTLEKRLELLTKRREMVENELAKMHETLDTMRYKCWFYETACELGSFERTRRIKKEGMPPHIRSIKEKMDAKLASLTAKKKLPE